VPPVASKVRRLSGGQRQALAIARAAGWGGKIVIMDEPTAALGVQETEKVEQTIRSLRDNGVAVLLISHNFDQVMRLSDHVWVMRAGLAVAGRRTADTSGEELVALITGAKGS
jgi:simple sugar transport system ATP-binding protein